MQWVSVVPTIVSRPRSSVTFLYDLYCHFPIRSMKWKLHMPIILEVLSAISMIDRILLDDRL